ncbi:hypothetical protein LOZ53_002350 [Ophidiomyces ophidiicola]|uniref:Uncharacterized protein n=1 Tax=Ophidiomyces ophidiicola TaxID=1387563 RepID=A0ACB8V586_9EURO|nr:uncharacterized protein LOZ57_006065 [Ophidiomyces ophidiicola]KAI1911803.1 hypothetical protein LOZ61_003676 [Ophidiomyces ophidiicola]KAI1923595.1 hypothetical protein LOZ64_000852 [Ophidiomyces ophidiicola]KAI1928417.1 hypothetical protein LOZ60_002368 [Ophidiomyces ophidiicola]KAI1939781.1 hypothetical protein LOZ57_006065 [Ophidiomyces ophidiicola]KAI1956153.1 hypothetical protein LOZ62_000147 [Ophidiomyces ophidiicola]
MPSFYSAAANGLPTPPHVHMGNRVDVDQPYFPPGLPPPYSARFANGCDPVDHYSAAYGPPVSTHLPHLHPAQSNRDMKAALFSRPQQPLYSSIVTGAHAASLRSSTSLPPMDNAIPPQYRRREHSGQQEHKAKEQKSTGGVAAHLDYDMDQMTDFVAEMAQGMYALYTSKIRLSDIDMLRSVYPGTAVPRQFRKYVYQILSSTRLPSSTILLGLYYLASRMRMLSTAEVYGAGSGEVYRMLTVALLLGSKFLDDNTFQNRSWSEVSNIPVADLNSMELEWLFAFDWRIHNRIHNQNDGFMTWKAHWDTWRAKSDARVYESRTKLAPIDTTIQRHHSIQKPLLSPEGPIPPQYQRSGWLTPMSSDYSPPSAPPTGPNTPDYFQAAPWPFNNPPPYSRSWAVPQQFITSRSQPPSYQPTPSYAPAFSAAGWHGHGIACGCLYCAKGPDHYLSGVPFGLQPVAG